MGASFQEKLEEIVDGRGLTQAGTQRRIKWKNIGALADDLESRGNSRSVLGPVASEVVNIRLAEASLGLRPTLKSRQARKLAPTATPIIIDAATRSSETKRPTPASQATSSGGLSSLRLPPRVMAILHSLQIRSVNDLKAADDKVLAKHLTMTQVKALKDRCRAVVPPPKGSKSLRAANLPLRAVKVLNGMGLMKIADLAAVSEADLRAEPKLGKNEVLAILRICRDHDVSLKGP